MKKANKQSDKIISGYKLIFGYLGIFLVLIGGIILLPLLIIPFLPTLITKDAGISFIADPFNSGTNLLENINLYRDAHWWPAFVIPASVAIIIGLVLFFSLIFKKEKDKLKPHHDSILLVLVWISAMIFCAFPFYLRNMNWETFTWTNDQFSFIGGLYEATSGLCSIGLTLFKGLGASLPDIPTLSPLWDGYYIYCIYRSILLFFGGVGLVLVVGSALSDRYGINLYRVEGHNDKLLPNLRKSSGLILRIYIGYILIGTIAYVLFGMSIFDALNHSISAISTGGFSPRSESIAFYALHDHQLVGGFYECNALAIEIVTIVLMLLGSTNFITHYKLLKFKFKQTFDDIEIKLVAILFIIFVPLFLIAVNLSNPTLPIQDNLRYSIFHFVSVISTTGLSNNTNAFSSTSGIILFTNPTIFMMTILMFIGGGAGSTSGAAKQQRIGIGLKNLSWSSKASLFGPNLVLPRRIKRHGEIININDDDIKETNNMILIYLVTLLAGALAINLLMAKSNVLPHTAMFEFMSALSSTGFSLPEFDVFQSINNTFANNLSMLILVFGMFIGRLEILQVFIAIGRVSKDLFKRR